MKPSSLIIAAGILVAGALTTVWSFPAPAFEARVSDAAGVSIMVTPRPLAPGSTTWEFEVAMNTHVRPLAEDLTTAAVLIEADGQRAAPVGWQGDPPGGHHRKGVLRFPAPSAPQPTFELQLSGVGGAALRTFRWDATP